MRVQRSIAFGWKTVTTVATEHLREQIVCGSVDPGETLPESRVGERLGGLSSPDLRSIHLAGTGRLSPCPMVWNEQEQRCCMFW